MAEERTDSKTKYCDQENSGCSDLPLFAEVIIDISHEKLDFPFTYRIPEEWRGRIGPGSVVEIPFGRGDRLRKGYVIGLTEHCSYPAEKIKDIRGIAAFGDETAERQMQLAVWMKEQYGSTLSASLKTVLSSRGKGKGIEHREIICLVSQEEAREKLMVYSGKHQVAKVRLLRALMETPRIPYGLASGKLHVSVQTIRSMKGDGILDVQVTRSLRDPVSFGDSTWQSRILSRKQTEIVEAVTRDIRQERSSAGLLHGITGSGKTEVYIAIIEQVIRLGKQAIVLIPEIGLTYQTLLRFYHHFGNRVSVMNSSLTEAEKADQFERAKQGEIDVIIGPRSALFTPFPRIGIIIVDEEHESSYKNESMPKYHVRETACKIASMHKGSVLLGSATPSLTSYYRAQQGEYRLYTLTERLTGGDLPSVYIADMKKELKRGNRSILSGKLRELLEDRLEKKEQIMLFLNRRGFSGFVSCRACGYVAKCPHCDVPLSLHGNRMLVCHYCGHEEAMPYMCPSCGSGYISGFRAGTEQIQQILSKMYPKARILRMDADTTRKKGDYEKILSSFAAEEADILLGTQMIVKGHDFPNVTLVGILLADLSLYAGDYGAAERTFQLLTQAAGRAGRGEKPGEVVIQTYHPENYAVAYAAKQDYKGFYQEEIRYRQLLQYPPVRHMLAVQLQSVNEDLCLQRAGEVRELLNDRVPAAAVIGPAAAALGKLRDQYRFVLYIKDGKYDTLVNCKNLIEEEFKGEQVQIQFDFDPVSVY